jgi:hypothetical protein
MPKTWSEVSGPNLDLSKWVEEEQKEWEEIEGLWEAETRQAAKKPMLQKRVERLRVRITKDE